MSKHILSSVFHFSTLMRKDLHKLRVVVNKAKKLPAEERDKIIHKIRYQLAIRRELVHFYPAW